MTTTVVPTPQILTRLFACSQLLSLIHLTATDSPFPCFQPQSSGAWQPSPFSTRFQFVVEVSHLHLVGAPRSRPGSVPAPSLPRTPCGRRSCDTVAPATRRQELQPLGHAAVRQLSTVHERHPPLGGVWRVNPLRHRLVCLHLLSIVSVVGGWASATSSHTLPFSSQLYSLHSAVD